MYDEGASRKRRRVCENEERSAGRWSSLPPELTFHILAYLSFHEIAELRLVSQLFNQCGKQLLNKEAKRIVHLIRSYINKVKSELPRGTEQLISTRPIIRPQKYRLWKEIESSMHCLYSSYRPYIEDGSCCFIAGKILDLANTIMSLDDVNNDLITELIYLRCKAVDHFHEITINWIKLCRNRSTAIGLKTEPHGVLHYWVLCYGAPKWPHYIPPLQAGSSSTDRNSCFSINVPKTNSSSAEMMKVGTQIQTQHVENSTLYVNANSRLISIYSMIK